MTLVVLKSVPNPVVMPVPVLPSTLRMGASTEKRRLLANGAVGVVRNLMGLEKINPGFGKGWIIVMILKSEVMVKSPAPVHIPAPVQALLTGQELEGPQSRQTSASKLPQVRYEVAAVHSRIPEGEQSSTQSISFWHVAEQPSPLVVLLSSHCSTPPRTNPSPQTALRQLLVQASVLLALPSSHCSPASVIPLPQNDIISIVHAEEQPSPFVRLPSSHCSTLVRTKLSPQMLFVQLFLHASLLLPLPSSHCSAPSTVALPQSGGVAKTVKVCVAQLPDPGLFQISTISSLTSLHISNACVFPTSMAVGVQALAHVTT